MVVLEEKLGGGPTDRPTGMLRIMPGALFLENSRVHATLLELHERLPCTRTVYGKCMNDIRGPAQEAYVTCVSGFPCRVYINSNLHDSRICVTTCSWQSSCS
jgi:hypothetical protein